MGKSNLYSRYKQDADACKYGYYGYEYWLEKKLIEAESELKKLRVGDVSKSWDWTIFVAGFCTGLLLISVILFIKNGC